MRDRRANNNLLSFGDAMACKGKILGGSPVQNGADRMEPQRLHHSVMQHSQRAKLLLGWQTRGEEMVRLFDTLREYIWMCKQFVEHECAFIRRCVQARDKGTKRGK